MVWREVEWSQEEESTQHTWQRDRALQVYGEPSAGAASQRWPTHSSDDGPIHPSDLYLHLHLILLLLVLLLPLPLPLPPPQPRSSTAATTPPPQQRCPHLPARSACSRWRRAQRSAA